MAHMVIIRIPMGISLMSCDNMELELLSLLTNFYLLVLSQWFFTILFSMKNVYHRKAMSVLVLKVMYALHMKVILAISCTFVLYLIFFLFLFLILIFCAGGGYVITPVNQRKQSVVKHMLAIDWKFWKSYVRKSSARSITIRMLERVAGMYYSFS